MLPRFSNIKNTLEYYYEQLNNCSHILMTVSNLSDTKSRIITYNVMKINFCVVNIHTKIYYAPK